MIKKLLTLTLLTLSAFFLVGFKAQTQANEIIPGPLVKFGQTVYLKGQVDGDVFLFGGEVIVDATVSGDLIVVAGQADIKGKIRDDLRITAGQLNLQAQVGDDASLIAGQLEINPDSTIANSLLAAGGIIVLNGQIGDKVWLTASRVRFNGQADNDVSIKAGSIDIYPDTIINANLNLTYGQPPTINPKAQILGRISQHPKPLAPHSYLPLVKKITTLFIIEQITQLVIEILIGWLLIGLLSKPIKPLVNLCLKQPGDAIGWGFLSLVLTPVLGVLFIVTLIGIPLGIFTFMIYGLALFIARLLVSLVLGSRLLKDQAFKKPYLSFALGLSLVTLLKLIPFIGWLAYFVLILLGLGTLTLQVKSLIHHRLHE